ncbi:MAG: efflux RND transporter periplasmic adaptor subunit [Bacillota bacterium]
MNNRKKKKSSGKVIVWSIIGVLIIGLVAARFILPKKSNATEVIPTKGDITTYYSFSGSVEAKNRQSVFADRAMQIKEIKVNEGQTVKKDDVLLTSTTGEEIKAKIDGEVSNINAEENAQLMPGTQIMDVVDYAHLQFKVKVDEYDLSAISVGKDTTVNIHALNKDITGKIAEISKEGIYQNGFTYFTAIISLPSDHAIRVGMSAEAKVLNQSVKNVVTLPMSTIQFDENNQPYVNVKDGNKPPKRVNLELGVSDGVTVEVISGITASDTVLVPNSTPAGFVRMRNDRGPAADNSANTDSGANGGSIE